jgi:hypothetical protein
MFIKMGPCSVSDGDNHDKFGQILMKFIVNYVVPMLWRSDVTLSSMSHNTDEEGTWLFQGIYAILGTTDLHRFW